MLSSGMFAPRRPSRMPAAGGPARRCGPARRGGPVRPCASSVFSATSAISVFTSALSPKNPSFVFIQLRTLSFSVYNIFPFKRFAFNPFRTLSKNTGGGYQFFPHWNSKSSARYPNLHPRSSNPFSFKLLHTLLHAGKKQLIYSQAIPHSLRKTWGWGAEGTPTPFIITKFQRALYSSPAAGDHCPLFGHVHDPHFVHPAAREIHASVLRRRHVPHCSPARRNRCASKRLRFRIEPDERVRLHPRLAVPHHPVRRDDDPVRRRPRAARRVPQFHGARRRIEPAQVPALEIAEIHAVVRRNRQPTRPHSLGQRKLDRKSTRLNSSHLVISYAVFCLKKKKKPTVLYHAEPTETHQKNYEDALESS